MPDESEPPVGWTFVHGAPAPEVLAEVRGPHLFGRAKDPRTIIDKIVFITTHYNMIVNGPTYLIGIRLSTVSINLCSDNFVCLRDRKRSLTISQ